MNREDSIGGFLVLKEVITNLADDEKNALFNKAKAANPWYTSESIIKAINGICHILDQEKIIQWVANYPLNNSPRRVGIIMAGNIPLVGFHDLLCTLISGHIAVVKLSSQDEVLPKFIIHELININNEFKSRIEIVDKLTDIEAVIATGSDNSSRYFRKYFKAYPHIIRKNRTSIAILDGHESEKDLENLGDDIFSYFGMGCRNVSKLFLPNGYDLTRLIARFEKHNNIANHPKYFNNYEYNKAIYLVNRVEHLDNGFALFRESRELVSPLSVVYYEFYNTVEEVERKTSSQEDKIQCLVGQLNFAQPLIPFGKAQLPAVDDYADNIDTMKFLNKL